MIPLETFAYRHNVNLEKLKSLVSCGHIEAHTCINEDDALSVIDKLKSLESQRLEVLEDVTNFDQESDSM
jgi:hypothetical protein